MRDRCDGPVELMDQGIGYCYACDGCECCSHKDHSEAEYVCFTNPLDGVCVLKAHAGRFCDDTGHDPGDEDRR